VDLSKDDFPKLVAMNDFEKVGVRANVPLGFPSLEPIFLFFKTCNMSFAKHNTGL
jgi:hypothetical protein